MRVLQALGAASFFAVINAAPRVSSDEAGPELQGMKPTLEARQDAFAEHNAAAPVLACPTGKVIVSTTTIDITVFVTVPAETAAVLPSNKQVVDCEESGVDVVATTTTFITTTAPCEESAVDPVRTGVSFIIDTAIEPVSTAVWSAYPTHTSQPTTTICPHHEPTGAPSQDSTYCGIHGKPAGTYFIAEFIEDRPGVPVSEEGCYQFCNSIMESTAGCKSYRFSHNQLGAPRCSLYGMPVSYSVEDIDQSQPDIWHDVTCGSPTEKKWHEKMPKNHAKRRWW